MCKLIIGIQNKPTKDFAENLEAQLPLVEREPHGLGGLKVMRDGSVEVLRRYKDYKDVREFVLSDLDKCLLVSVHGRTATSGENGILNVHFFSNKDTYFAHNGFVSEAFGGAGYKDAYEREKELFEPDETDDTYIAQTKEEGMIHLEALKACKQCVIFSKWWCAKHKETASLFESCKEVLEQEEMDQIQAEIDEEVEQEKEKGHQNILPPGKPYNTGYSYNAGYSTGYSTNNYFTGKCDSFRYLDLLASKKDIFESHKTFLRQARKRSFSGIGLLYNAEKQAGYILATRELKMQTDNKNYTLLYSYEPYESMYEERSFMGFPVRETVKAWNTVSVPEGIYKLTRGENSFESHKVK